MQPDEPAAVPQNDAIDAALRDGYLQRNEDGLAAEYRFGKAFQAAVGLAGCKVAGLTLQLDPGQPLIVNARLFIDAPTARRVLKLLVEQQYTAVPRAAGSATPVAPTSAAESAPLQPATVADTPPQLSDRQVAELALERIEQLRMLLFRSGRLL